MKKFLLITMLTASLLQSTASASIKRVSEVSRLTLDQTKTGSAVDGTVLLDVVGRLQAGDLVVFNVPGKRALTGKVTKSVIIEDRIIRIVGIFLNEPDSGFGFIFDKEGTINGALTFNNNKETYRLRYNTALGKFYFARDISLAS